MTMFVSGVPLNLQCRVIGSSTLLLMSVFFPSSTAFAQTSGLDSVDPQQQLEELEAAPRLSFGVLWGRVINDNPDIDIADAQITQAEQLRRQSGSYRFPTIELSGEIGPEYNDPVTTTDSGRETTNGRNLSLTLSKLLLDGGSSRAEFQRSKRLEDAAKANEQVVEEDLFSDVSSRYIDYWRFQEDLTQVEIFVSTMEDLVADLDAMYRGGAASKLETDFARARLATARAAASTATASLNNAFSELAFLAPGLDLFLAFPPDTITEIKLFDEERYIDQGAASNSEFATNQEAINASRLRVKSQRGQFFPTLSFELSGSVIDDEGGTTERRDKLSAKLLLNYTLYSGGARRGGLRRAEAQVTELRAEREQLDRDVRRDIGLAYNSITASRLTLSAVTDEIEANMELQRLNRQNLEVGTINIIEVIDVEERLFNARTRKNEVIALMHTQYIDLLIASGYIADLLTGSESLASDKTD